MIQELLDEEEPRPAYTPITAAAIGVTEDLLARESFQRPEDNYITGRAGPAELLPFPPAKQPATQFEPKYKLMSARERKMLNLYGCSSHGSVKSFSEPTSVLETPVHPSARRMRDRTLIPATLSWACNSPIIRSMNSGDMPSRSVRRKTTDLMAATQPWATPAPPKAVTPLVQDARRQANDLIPCTMPWVTPYVTPSEKGIEKPLFSDHRRKKGIMDENFPPTGSLIDSGIIQAVRPDIPYSPAEITRWRISRIPVNGNEEEFIRKLLSSKGIHVIRAKADIDIVTNACRGAVNVLLRSVDRAVLEQSVREADLQLTET